MHNNWQQPLEIKHCKLCRSICIHGSDSGIISTIDLGRLIGKIDFYILSKISWFAFKHIQFYQ